MTVLRKKTKQLLTESLKDLASKNTINKISVSDIARNCNMSNSNFYHHFADKYELISYIINGEIDKRINYEPMTLQELLDHLLDIIDDDPEFYSNVLSNTLFEYPNHGFFHEMLDPKIKDLIVSDCMTDLPDKRMERILHVYLAGLTAALCNHVMYHRLSREDLIDAFIVAVPDKLTPLIVMEEDTGADNGIYKYKEAANPVS